MLHIINIRPTHSANPKRFPRALKAKKKWKNLCVPYKEHPCGSRRRWVNIHKPPRGQGSEWGRAGASLQIIFSQKLNILFFRWTIIVVLLQKLAWLQLPLSSGRGLLLQNIFKFFTSLIIHDSIYYRWAEKTLAFDHHRNWLSERYGFLKVRVSK